MIFFWVILYGLVYTLSEAASAVLNNAVWLTPLAMTGYTSLLILWLISTGQARKAGLVLPRFQKTDLPYLLLLLLLPLCNLLISKPVPSSFFTVLLMLSVCTAEELFFRGTLLSCLSKRIGRRSIPAASAVFALFHLANLLSGWPLDYVAVQVLLAFSAGFYFCILRIRCKSLIPCAIAHFLTNITAGDAFSVHQASSFAVWLPCSTLLLVCNLLSYSKIPVKMEDYS